MRALVAAAEQHDQCAPLLAEINSGAWPLIHSQLAHAFAYRFAITEIALPHARQPRENPRHGFLVIQIVQPFLKRHSPVLRAEGDDFFWRGEHQRTVAFKLPLRQVEGRDGGDVEHG